jgi:hypothetical protein
MTPGTKVDVQAGDQTIERLLKQRGDSAQIRKLMELARANSGEVVAFTSFDPGDELCPRFRFKWPVPPRFGSLLSELTNMNVPYRVFTHGIINPEALFVDVGNRGRAF